VLRRSLLFPQQRPTVLLLRRVSPGTNCVVGLVEPRPYGTAAAVKTPVTTRHSNLRATLAGACAGHCPNVDTVTWSRRLGAQRVRHPTHGERIAAAATAWSAAPLESPLVLLIVAPVPEELLMAVPGAGGAAHGPMLRADRGRREHERRRGHHADAARPGRAAHAACTRRLDHGRSERRDTRRC
jgi:hypothetical protein